MGMAGFKILHGICMTFDWTEPGTAVRQDMICSNNWSGKNSFHWLQLKHCSSTKLRWHGPVFAANVSQIYILHV